MNAYAEIIVSLKEIYKDNEIPEVIETVEKEYKSTTARQRRKNQEYKKALLVDYLQAIFSKSVCDTIMLKNDKGEYTLNLKTISGSVDDIDSYEVSSGDDKKICNNFTKTELYIMTILDGIQEDKDKKHLTAVLNSFQNTKTFIDNTLCNLEIWKNDKNALFSSFPYWSDLQKEVQKKYIAYDIKLLYSIAKDKDQHEPAIITLEKGLEIEFALKNEGRERIAVTHAEKAINIKSDDEKTEIQQLLNKSLKATEITLDDNTSIYYMTDNDEHYTRTYYFLMDKVDGEEKQITGLTMVDINTLSALLKLAADDLITNREIIYSFRDIVRTVYGRTRLSINEYDTVYNSLVKLSSFVGRVKSNHNYTTKVYDLIKCSFYYPKSTEEQGDIDYDTEQIKTYDSLRKEDSFALLHVNVKFSSEYIDRLKHAVFLDKKLSNKISNNRLAKAISVLLQTERYEWYKQCLDRKINEKDEVRLNHKEFFCRQLYLPLSGRKMYRDRDNILEVMKMIADTKIIIQGEVSFDTKTWDYCFHYVDISNEEVSEIQNTVSNLSNKVLIPFLPIEEK